jgi:HSP20 family protein
MEVAAQMTLFRYDPFREFDRFTDSYFNRSGDRRSPWIPLDAVRHGDDVELRFDLPGVKPESIDVSVERNVLTLKAERTWAPADGDEVLAAERAHGTWTRQVWLGETLDPERLEANYEHGVLTIRVPVAEQAKPRRVEIKVGESQPAIDVGSEAA